MVFEKLKEIISEQLEVNTEDITLESNIMDDFDADSLDLVDIVMSVEDEFGVEVPEDAVEKIKTVGDVVNFIEENM
ncbi:MAG: acyl carrier protein [Oscillospiraceae bacterium]|nr:acyl carrier protein [Oscillospiraceae bacterium]